MPRSFMATIGIGSSKGEREKFNYHSKPGRMTKRTRRSMMQILNGIPNHLVMMSEKMENRDIGYMKYYPW